MINNFSIILLNILIFLTPLAEYLNFTFYIALLLSTLVPITKAKIYSKNIFYIILIFIIASFMHGFPKGILSTLVFLAAFYNFSNYKISNLYSIYLLITINYLLVTMQLIGINELFYAHTNYSNESSFRPFFNYYESSIYLPQIRPSGMFPAPTLISCFLIYLLTTFIYFQLSINKFYQFIVGSMLALVGSTMGLLIIILFFIVLFFRKKFIGLILGYIITITLYKLFLSDFFVYNFSYDDILVSIVNRKLDESIIYNNIEFLLIMCTIFPYVLIRFYKVIDIDLIIKITSVLILLFLPSILHDISNSLLGFYFFGVGFGLLNFYKRHMKKIFI